MASTRSRFVSSVRVTIVAIVSHANPSTIGITARPLSPSRLKTRSTRRARRGKYPLSSRIEEEGPHDRQDDRDGVPHPQRENSVLADEERAEGVPGDRCKERFEEGIDLRLEEDTLHPIDNRSRAELPHELVQAEVEDEQQDRDPGPRLGEPARHRVDPARTPPPVRPHHAFQERVGLTLPLNRNAVDRRRAELLRNRRSLGERRPRTVRLRLRRSRARVRVALNQERGHRPGIHGIDAPQPVPDRVDRLPHPVRIEGKPRAAAGLRPRDRAAERTHAPTFHRDDRNHLDAQTRRQSLRVDLDAAPFRFIHHVERDYEGPPQLR